MAVARWDPFTVLARLDDDFDQLVRRTWGASTGAGRNSGYVPPVDIVMDGPDVLITLELPGVEIERDVDIEVHEGRLMISGQRRPEEDDGGAGDASEPGVNRGRRVLVREMRYGSFRREFALPEGVAADDVEASYDRGVLQLRVRSVAKPVQQPRKIAVRSTPGDRARTAATSGASQVRDETGGAATGRPQ